MAIMAEPQKLIDRAQPHSLEAERGVLGSLLLDPRVCDDVAMVVRPEEFYTPGNRKVFELMLELHSAGKQIDAMLLIDRLKANGDFDMLGGTSFLLDIAECVPTAANAVWYAQIVRDKAVVRDIIHASTEILRDAYDQSAKPSDLLAAAEQKIYRVAERPQQSQVGEIGERMMAALGNVRERMNNRDAVAVSTPWRDLNRRIGGFRSGEFYVIAARPRMGKTSLALNLSDYVVRRLGKGVLFVSLEMSADELCEKSLAARTSINSAAIRDGNLTDDDMRTLLDAGCEFTDLPLTIDDTPSRTLLDIASQARRLKRQGKLGLLVVDHLGLIVSDNPKAPRHEQVATITRRLKILARELQVPVIALAQLNRDVEKDRDHRPRLSSLRESGSIEQDAGTVLFIHREEEYRPDDTDLRGKAELIVAKCRNGEAGIVPLLWIRETQDFRSVVLGEPWKGLE